MTSGFLEFIISVDNNSRPLEKPITALVRLESIMYIQKYTNEKSIVVLGKEEYFIADSSYDDIKERIRFLIDGEIKKF